MFTPSICFAPSVLLPGRRTHHRFQSSRPVSCVISPQKRPTTKKNFHVLPPDMPASERPPLPPRYYGVPRIGRILEGILGRPASVSDKVATHGRIFSSNYLAYEMTHICDYQAITDIFRSPDVFINAGAVAGLEAMFPGNPLSLDGKAHAESRGLLSPAFAHSLFPLSYATIQKRTSQFWAQVFQAVSTSREVQIRSFISPFYLGTIVELTTGIKMDDDRANRIRHVFEQVINGLITFNMGPLAKPAFDAQTELVQILRTIVLDCIRDNKQVIDELRKYGDDFSKHRSRGMKDGSINLLLVLIATSSLSTELGADLDDSVIDQLVNTLSAIWFAGHETSSSTTLSSLFELGLNPDIYQQLTEEQDKLVADHNGIRDVAYNQLSQMPLLDSFISEVLRTHPAALSIERIASQDVEILGRFVAKGTTVSLNMYAAHKDDSVYPESDKFKADRFLDKKKVPPVLTFGAPGSAHHCIGAGIAKMQIKCLLATLLREYMFVLDPSQSREFQLLPQVAPKSGVVVGSLTCRAY